MFQEIWTYGRGLCSEFGAKEASVILKTCVYSFVPKAWPFFLFHEFPPYSWAEWQGLLSAGG